MVQDPSTVSPHDRLLSRSGCVVLVALVALGVLLGLLLIPNEVNFFPASSLIEELWGPERDKSEEIQEPLDGGGQDDQLGGNARLQPVPTPTDTPHSASPTPTFTPAPALDAPGEVSEDEFASQPEPEPDPEPWVEAEFHILGLLGLAFKCSPSFTTGTTAAGVSSNDPYAFAKSGMPAVEIELRSMPTESFPGSTPAEGLHALYQQRLIAKHTAGEWAVVTEPFDLEIQGQPASRMAAEYAKGDRMYCYHISAIRGTTRAGFVHGSFGQPCADGHARNDDIVAVSDSVQLHDPEPVCSVGLASGSEPPKYGVGCDYAAVGWVGVDALKDKGYTDIVLQSVTWDDAAAFMRQHDQPGW